ncbi:MAG: hypothetical protein Unbinned1529contig1001_38 [Prokaryotic dsDNA virus sp.]|nr:MAG: hypothetical protein Unbinned1529contig1001_38 [Prokaryotic dsDNA virus sp.]|tara:strand:+ start:52 stop:345 length:294 start_codon:yes stop_codon:yes gene_type:complete
MGRRKLVKNMGPNEFLCSIQKHLDRNIVDTWLFLYAAQIGLHQALAETENLSEKGVVGLISTQYTKQQLRTMVGLFDEWNTQSNRKKKNAIEPKPKK